MRCASDRDPAGERDRGRVAVERLEQATRDVRDVVSNEQLRLGHEQEVVGREL
jgi:hypothetical protein